MKTLSVPVCVLLSLTCCAGAPSHDAVRLGGLTGPSLQQRVPNSCSTTTGSPCVFPFTYGGLEYSQCSYADSPLAWCATATQADGSVITNSWGDCDLSSSTTSCQAETLSLPSCSTTAGDCVFPFRHDGVVYRSCTTADTGVSWCSTAVTAQGDHVAGSEGTCPASCDSTTTSTTAPTTSTTTSTTTSNTAPTTTSTTTSSTSTSCTPGQLSTVECNTCVCNSLGQQVCTTDTCSSTTSSSTTSTTASTTTSSTTTTSTTTATASSCLTVSGPDTGSSCVFPFTFNSVTYVSCAEWVYGGTSQGEKWCSTKVDTAGVHVNGEGNYGFCSSDCNPSVSLADILAGLGINTNSAFRRAEDQSSSSVLFRGGDNP